MATIWVGLWLVSTLLTFSLGMLSAEPTMTHLLLVRLVNMLARRSRAALRTTRVLGMMMGLWEWTGWLLTW